MTHGHEEGPVSIFTEEVKLPGSSSYASAQSLLKEGGNGAEEVCANVTPVNLSRHVFLSLRTGSNALLGFCATPAARAVCHIGMLLMLDVVSLDDIRRKRMKGNAISQRSIVGSAIPRTNDSQSEDKILVQRTVSSVSPTTCLAGRESSS